MTSCADVGSIGEMTGRVIAGPTVLVNGVSVVETGSSAITSDAGRGVPPVDPGIMGSGVGTTSGTGVPLVIVDS